MVHDVMNQLSLIEETDAHIEDVKSRLLTARRVPLITDSDIYESPEDVYGIYRDGGGNCLGVVGSNFRPANLSNYLDSLREAVYGCCDSKLDLRKLTYSEHYGGKKVNFRIHVRDIKIGAHNLGDITKLYIDFWTGFDGKTPFTASAHAFRPWCANGCGTWAKQLHLKFRNTQTAEAKMTLYSEQLVEQLAHLDDYEQFLNALTYIKVTPQQVKEFMQKCLNYDDTYKESKIKERRADEFMEDVNTEFAHTDSTLYSLLQGATRFTTHRVAKTDSDVLLRTSVKTVEARAYDACMELLN